MRAAIIALLLAACHGEFDRDVARVRSIGPFPQQCAQQADTRALVAWKDGTYYCFRPGPDRGEPRADGSVVVAAQHLRLID